MHKFFLGSITLSAFIFAASCGNQNNQDSENVLPDHNNSLMALDWPGVYFGVLPCADCEGIETTIVLGADMTYNKEMLYMGKSDEIFRETGKLEADETGNKLIFVPSGEATEKRIFKLGENTLTRLDMAGNAIEGQLAEKYILRQINIPFLEKRWDFIQVYETDRTAIEKMERKPYIVFKAARNRAYGNSSCNRFTGSFVSESDNLLKFNPMMSTKMACSSDNAENQILSSLQETDSYQINGDTLQLMNGEKGTLATLLLSSEPLDE
ncbi:MAG: copper resistance protein NlpE N-terminal domain-containing protein [Flavobacteriales bacterium]